MQGEPWVRVVVVVVAMVGAAGREGERAGGWWEGQLATLLSKQQGSHYHAGGGVRPMSECFTLSLSRR